MAKWGLFVPGGSKPSVEYEGDHITPNTNTGIVEITDKNNATVAVVRLAEGQSVKKIDET